MTVFQLSIDSKSGSVTIWIEAPCGLKPILVCPNLNAVEEFADMLLEYCRCKRDEQNKIREVSTNLLTQALGSEESFESG